MQLFVQASLGVPAVFLLAFLSAAEALRCYSCNSQNNQNCVDLSERCQHNIDCRADFIAHCSNMENACAVVYGPGSQVWRGCYNEPRRTVISNDQTCTRRDGIDTCICQVEMCNSSSKMSGFSLLPAALLLACSVLLGAR